MSVQNYETYFKELILSDEKLHKLQKVLLGIVEDIDYVCRKYLINYSLSGGSCLGAVRHQGFIPWDDDVDILIQGYDKKRFYDAILKEFPDKYEIQDYDYNKTANIVSKVILKGTKLVELFTENWPYTHGIFVDIFTFENTNGTKLGIKIRKFFLKLFKLLYCKKMYCKYPPTYIQSKFKEYPELKKYYNRRMWIANLFFFLSAEKCFKIYYKLRIHNKKTGYVSVPDTTYDYDDEIFKYDDICETIDAEFEGKSFKILKNYDLYLKQLYGDYMKIPPEKDRHRHISLEVNFGDYIK